MFVTVFQITDLWIRFEESLSTDLLRWNAPREWLREITDRVRR